MTVFKIDPIPGTKASLEVFQRDAEYEWVMHHDRPCVIVCPGGAYTNLSDREGEPIAKAFVSAGFQAFILNYSVRSSQNIEPLGDTPMREAAAAIRYVRMNAESFGIAENKISICGFSAGGHLAASTGILWNDESRIPGGKDRLGRPDAMILAYPVISSGKIAHRETIGNLSGIYEEDSANECYSLEKYVSRETSPAFLWHTLEDDAVPVENSLFLADALQRNKVPYEMHLFPKGHHGLSLATAEVGFEMPYPARWFPLALEWLNVMNLGTGYE